MEKEDYRGMHFHAEAGHTKLLLAACGERGCLKEKLDGKGVQSIAYAFSYNAVNFRMAEMDENEQKTLPYEEWKNMVEKLTIEHYGPAAKQVALLRSIHSLIERDMEQFKVPKDGRVKERKPGNWLYPCGHQRMRPASGEILPDPCEDEHLSEEERAVGKFPTVEEGGKKLAELQKAETWNDVYKNLKVRVTLESVRGEKTKISEAVCVLMAKAIKNMLKQEFGERWGHHVSSTHRFIIY